MHKRKVSGFIIIIVVVCGLTAMICACLYLYQRSTPAPLERVPWTESRLTGQPEGAVAYELKKIPGFKSEIPIAYAAIRRSTDAFVLQADGLLLHVREGAENFSCSPIVDAGHAAFGMTIDPEYAENGFLYLMMVEQEGPDELIAIRRYRFDSGDSLQAGKEPTYVDWKLEGHFHKGGHTGGGMAFGPDGKLYVATGDAGSSYGTGPAYLLPQDPGSLYGKMLRLDPQVFNTLSSAAPDASITVQSSAPRPEVFGVGLRNPWKLIRLPESNELLVFDVGEDLWEAAYRVTAGANYGWPLLEGSHVFRPDLSHPSAPDQISKPVIEHSHFECLSILGGLSYSGNVFPSLTGKVLYGDYTSGTIFASDLTSPPERIALTGLHLTEIANSTSGEPLFLSESGDAFRLSINAAQKAAAPFPKRLSQTGLFKDPAKYIVSPGIIRFEVNASRFADGMKKWRHLAIPGNGKIKFNEKWPWSFPERTVLVQTFVDEVAKPPYRLETRLMLLENQQWRGFSYRWNQEQTDASLVGIEGDRFEYTLDNGESKSWQIPSRMECMMCHNHGTGFVLGLSTSQTNREVSNPKFEGNQLDYFELSGLFENPMPRLHRIKGMISTSAVHTFPRLVSPADATGSLQDRAVAYLHSNCSHCHRYLGGGNSAFTLDARLDVDEWNILGAKPAHVDFGLPDARIVAPGAPERSVLMQRMKIFGPPHMPKIGTTLHDEPAINLIEDWIASLPAQ